ncbi:translation initiation factor IF-5A, partial [Methanocaldococcus sp.]
MPGTKQVNVGSLKVGQYVMIDGIPCEIVDISVSKPGKHGGAKARVVGIG